MADQAVRTSDDVVSAAASAAGPHIGDVVFFRLLGASEDGVLFAGKAQAAGVPKDILPTPLAPRQAYQHTMRELKIEGYILRQMEETPEKIGWALVDEEKPAIHERAYGVVGKMWFFKSARGQGTFQVELAGDGRQNGSRAVETAVVLTRITNAYRARIGTVTTTQVRHMVQDFCRARHGVLMGSAWFVPGAHGDLLRRLRALVNDLGSSKMDLLPVHDSADARGTVSAAVHSSIEGDLALLKEEIDSFTSDTRKGALERRKQAKLYAGMLDMTVGDLETKIGALERHVADLIGVKKEAA